MARTRRARSVLLSVGVTVALGIVNATNWSSLIAVAPSLVLTAILMLRLGEEPNRALLTVATGVGVGTLLWSALSESNPVGSAGIAAALAVAIDSKSSRPGIWGVVGFCTIVAVSALVFTTGSPNALGTLLKLTVVAGVWMVAIIDNGAEARLLTLFEQAKDNERELSVLNERRRFAADLHDIQGHSLHAIKLKAAVAARVRTTDPERTDRELEAIQGLAADSIRTARALAEDTHLMTFTSELSSVTGLMTAAGIETTVHRPADTPDASHDALLARVLREATTNILRHSRAEQVSVSVMRSILTVTNDGARGLPSPGSFRGLAALRRALQTQGGDLELEYRDGTVVLTATAGGDR